MKTAYQIVKNQNIPTDIIDAITANPPTDDWFNDRWIATPTTRYHATLRPTDKAIVINDNSNVSNCAILAPHK